MFKFNNINSLIQELLFPSYLVKPFWGAVIGAAVSLYSGRKAGKSAGAAGGASIGLERDKLDFAKERYADYKEKYGGLEDDLLASIDEFSERNTLARHAGQGVADVRSAYGKAREMGDRKLTRYGIDPGDQRFISQGRESSLDEAKSEMFARSKAREKVEAEEDKLFAKRLSAGRFGKGISDQERGVTSAMGSLAGAYGREAEEYAKQAGAGYGLAGKYIGKAVDDYSSGGGYSDMMRDEGAVWEGSNYVESADTGELGW